MLIWCATPLFHEYMLGDNLALTTGSLDEAIRFPPKDQFGMEAVVPWFGGIAEVRNAGSTEQTMAEFVTGIQAGNNQHLDNGTDHWPI